MSPSAFYSISGMEFLARRPESVSSAVLMMCGQNVGVGRGYKAGLGMWAFKTMLPLMSQLSIFKVWGGKGKGAILNPLKSRRKICVRSVKGCFFWIFLPRRLTNFFVSQFFYQHMISVFRSSEHVKLDQKEMARNSMYFKQNAAQVRKKKKRP
jgi:hypothetical protein